jgi:hypothetical protein
VEIFHNKALAAAGNAGMASAHPFISEAEVIVGTAPKTKRIAQV